MEKKLKLSISGASKKTISSIEQAKFSVKKYCCNRKKITKIFWKTKFFQSNKSSEIKSQSTFVPKKTNFSKPPSPITSDFERRKLAEQRATRRLKGENVQKIVNLTN